MCPHWIFCYCIFILWNFDCDHVGYCDWGNISDDDKNDDCVALGCCDCGKISEDDKNDNCDNIDGCDDCTALGRCADCIALAVDSNPDLTPDITPDTVPDASSVKNPDANSATPCDKPLTPRVIADVN